MMPATTPESCDLVVVGAGGARPERRQSILARTRAHARREAAGTHP
jgi:hypothetical protein